jgi:hypothetical protein
MSSPRIVPAEKPEGAAAPAGEAAHRETVPTVPAPPLDDEWDPTIDPMEGIDPATTWWGG